MGRWLTGLLDRVFAVISALLFAQLPLFMQQYQQQLFGHLSELSIQLDAIESIAAEGNKTLPQFVQHFLSSSDPDFMRQGELIRGMMDRFITLENAFQSLSSATPFDKPVVFFSHLNWKIASSTATHFQPGIPLSLEGVLYGFVGILFGYALFFLLRKIAFGFYRLFFSFEEESTVVIHNHHPQK